MADNKPNRGDSDNVLLQKIARSLSTEGGSGFATTAYVDTAVESIVGMAPDTLDTLGELAEALNNDPDFSDAITALVNEKVPLDGSDPMTGNLSTPGVQFLSGSEKVRAYVSSNVFNLEDRGTNGVRPIAKWDLTKTNGFAGLGVIGLSILDNQDYTEKVRFLFHHGAPDSASGVLYIVDGSGNTLATYDVASNTWTFSDNVVADNFIGDLTGNVTGNASTATLAAAATKLNTARTINGVSFDGTGNITVTADANTLTGTTLKSTVVSSSLTSVGTLVNLTVTNTITGSVSGNAGTATALASARTINGVSFDGTANITIPANNFDSHSTLTYAATTDIDFNSTDNFRTVTLTGVITFTTSNKAAARSRTIRIIGDSSQRALTFPAWKFVGSAAPATLAANKVAILTLTCFGTNDTDIVAAYAVEP